MLTRRQMLKSAAIGGIAAAAACSSGESQEPSQNGGAPYSLPPLPYSFDALEPHIDAMTMEIHHDRHHAGYVRKLNAAVKDYPELAKLSVQELMGKLSEVPEAIRVAVRNNGGGHANHSLFWDSMKQGGGGEPTGDLAAAINTAFGSFSSFKEGLTQAASGRFGSGWAWLALDSGKQLHIMDTPNQDTPLMQGRTPILGIDVWEHAYYLKYQNKRGDYINAWFNLVDWGKVSERYSSA